MAMVTAGSNKVRYLYHWQRLDIARLEETLTANAIYCQNPGKFNDPWDCKPHFDTTILLQPGEADKQVHHVQTALRQANPRISDAELERVRRMFHTDFPAAADFVEKMSAGMADKIMGRYRVYCLGTEVTNTLMWSHYADDHRGVCLVFPVCDPVTSGALKCEYLDTYPLLKLSDLTLTNLEALNRVLQIKAKAWEYEDEYRFVAFERATVRTSGVLVTDNNMLQLPPNAISAVIVGCQGDYGAVTDLVGRVAPHIAVKRAVRVPNRFELRIEG